MAIVKLREVVQLTSEHDTEKWAADYAAQFGPIFQFGLNSVFQNAARIAEFISFANVIC